MQVKGVGPKSFWSAGQRLCTAVRLSGAFARLRPGHKTFPCTRASAALSAGRRRGQAPVRWWSNVLHTATAGTALQAGGRSQTRSSSTLPEPAAGQREASSSSTRSASVAGDVRARQPVRLAMQPATGRQPAQPGRLAERRRNNRKAARSRQGMLYARCQIRRDARGVGNDGDDQVQDHGIKARIGEIERQRIACTSSIAQFNRATGTPTTRRDRTSARVRSIARTADQPAAMVAQRAGSTAAPTGHRPAGAQTRAAPPAYFCDHAVVDRREQH